MGGFCIGGLIALELAAELRAAGVEVLDPLIICDSPNLAARSYRVAEPWDAAGSIAEFERLEDQLADLQVGEARADAFPRARYAPPAGRAALLRKLPGVLPLMRLLKSHRDGAVDRALWSRTMDTLAAGNKVPLEERAAYCRIFGATSRNCATSASRSMGSMPRPLRSGSWC